MRIAVQHPMPGISCAVLMLALAVVLGGGGSPSPLPELVLQIMTALLLAWWLLREPESIAKVPIAVWWIVALPTALHLIHLTPLPPALWQNLPGRSAQVAALELVQAENSWRALSLSPARTLSSLLCLLSALALLIVTSTLSTAARWRLIAIIAGSGAATLVIGAAQIAGGTDSAFRFYDPDMTWLTGFQANRNSTADLLLVAMLALAALVWNLREQGWQNLLPPLYAAGLFAGTVPLALALFLTGSRTGLLLLPPVLLLQVLLFQTGKGSNPARIAAPFIAALTTAVIALALLRDNRMIAAVLERFKIEGEFRPELWRDGLFALGQYWPTGSGQGTFVPVMIAAERLEVVDPTLPNRAHNDFLELAIEGGLPALTVLAAIAAILVRTIWRGRQAGDPSARLQTLFGAAALCVFLLHSLVDYPLRSMALAAVAATAAGMLFPAKPAGRGRPGSR